MKTYTVIRIPLKNEVEITNNKTGKIIYYRPINAISKFTDQELIELVIFSGNWAL